MRPPGGSAPPPGSLGCVPVRRSRAVFEPVLSSSRPLRSHAPPRLRAAAHQGKRPPLVACRDPPPSVIQRSIPHRALTRVHQIPGRLSSAVARSREVRARLTSGGLCPKCLAPAILVCAHGAMRRRAKGRRRRFCFPDSVEFAAKIALELASQEFSRQLAKKKDLQTLRSRVQRFLSHRRSWGRVVLPGCHLSYSYQKPLSCCDLWLCHDASANTHIE